MSDHDEDLIDPDHYTVLKPQPIDVIEAWKLGPHEANVLKYVARAPYKGKEIRDLKKAIWYLQRKIGLLEARDRRVLESAGVEPNEAQKA